MSFFSLHRKAGIVCSTDTVKVILSKGQIYQMPAIAVIDNSDETTNFLGDDAEHFWGKIDSHVRIIRPVSRGNILDEDILQQIVGRLWSQVRPSLSLPFVAFVNIPTTAVNIYVRTMSRILLSLGFCKVIAVPQHLSVMSALELPFDDPEAHVFLEIESDLAVCSSVCHGTVTHFFSDEMLTVDRIDAKICGFMRESYGVQMDRKSYHSFRSKLFDYSPKGDKRVVPVTFFDTKRRSVIEVPVDTASVIGEVRPLILAFADRFYGFLSRLPIEMQTDIVKKGVILYSSGSALKGLGVLISHAIRLPVCISEQPSTLVAQGIAHLMRQNLRDYHQFAHSFPANMDSL